MLGTEFGGFNEGNPLLSLTSFRAMGNSPVGREVELEEVERFLAAATGGPATLVIEGAAGIGKTTLWEAALGAAGRDGRRLLAARGSSSEIRLAGAGLSDLLVAIDDERLRALPDPQRRALTAALLRDGDGAGERPDPRAVATGLLSLLELLAAEAPLVLAIDDLQWLDPSSADALRFAVRRLTGPVGVLGAERTDSGAAGPSPIPRDSPGLRRLRLAPLPGGDLAEIVAARTGRRPSGPLLDRILEVAAGNPFIAVELTRASGAEGRDLPERLPGSLRELVDARLAALTPAERRAVVFAAMASDPDVGTVGRALGTDDAVERLAAAERADILRLEGGAIVFTHPLLATGAYAALDPADRREAHRVLAAVSEGEERARHLALSCVEPEPEAVAALDAAAAEARARGSARAAAELLELGLRLGADGPARRLLAAEHHLDAGAVDRARELLDGLVAEPAPDPLHAAALARLAHIRVLAEDFPGAVPLLEAATAQTEDERARIAMALTLVFARTQSGALPDAVALAAETRERAEALGDGGLLAQALAVDAMVRYLAGQGAAEAQIDRALALEREHGAGSVMLSPSLIAGLIWSWSGRLDDAQAALSRAWQGCRDRGEESELVLATMQCGHLVCLRGDIALGRALAAEGIERAERLGSPSSRAFALENQLNVAAWVGEVDLARRAGAEALAIFEAVGSPVGKMFTDAALGALELALGDAEAAAARLVPAAEMAFAMEAGDPGNFWWTTDAVEALVALGRIAEAEPIRAWQRERAASLRRPGLLALAARTDGLVRAGEGDLAGAERLLEEALAEHARQPIAYDRARTLMALAGVRRRLRRRGAARESLAAARALFEELGARIWADRAGAELERLDAPRGPELTPTEFRVAALIGAGLTNRAAAAELFVSPKTVEATLTRVYRKLGIGSRAELGGWVAERAAAD
jgi:DNA-binding CsgD family transcriptional regulator